MEFRTLEKLGLRWAVLAAWHEDLRRRGRVLPGNLTGPLQKARLKISSGCFSTCEVGCDLAEIERTLVSAESSASPEFTDYWLDFLGRAMTESGDAAGILAFEPVRVQYSSCGLGRCQCGGA